MNKHKKFVALVLSLVMLSTTACSKPSNPTTGTKGEVVMTKTAKGYGGDVSVTVTFNDGVITKVEAVGDKETAGVGSQAIEQLPNAIVKANGIQIDSVSGATVTSSAIKSAVEQAIAEATGQGQKTAEVKMKPGTYSAETSGFSLIKKMMVNVTVSETKIEKIEVSDNGETVPFLQAAIEKLVPRMIENQSVKIDSITGATGSSTGIKQGTEAALIEALQAGGSEDSAIKNFYTTPSKSTEQKTLETDVLIVGLGGSGAASAMSAAETMYANQGNDASKVQVLAIDKAGKYGGTSCITADTMGINAPEYDKTYHGGKDYVDAKAMKADWNNFTKGDAKQELLDLFFDESGKTIDWLISHGFDYGKGTPDGEGFGFGGPQKGFTPQDIFHVKFQYTGQGYGNWKKETGEMFDNMMADYEKLGGKIMLEVEAKELIYDKATNTVTGVKAEGYDGTQYTIHAKKVIIGTGGFSKNAELQEKYLSNEYYPLQGSWLMYGMQQNDGKMMASALELGAGTYNIGMPPMVHLQGAPITMKDYPVEVVAQNDQDLMFWTQLPRTNSLNDFPQALASAAYGIQVNAQGKRFSNEAGTFQTWKSGPTYYTLWSDDFFANVKDKGLPVGFSDDLTCQGGINAETPIPTVYDVIEKCIEKKIAVKADTIEDLAKLLKMDATVLKETITKYNAAVDAQNDTEFEKDAELLTMKIADEGPYYAFTGASYIYSTVGGLDVNTDLQVLGSDNKTPINNFYAVGTDSLGVLFSEQREYVTYGGAAQGWAYTSGRLAGISAVNSLNK